jgi:integrase
MARHATNSVPSYRLHRQSGQAIVTLSDASTKERRDYPLGPFDALASREKYNRLIGVWMANGRRLPEVDSSPLTIEELIDRYCTWAEGYYRGGDGEQTSEIHSIYLALRVVRELYATAPAIDFGPLCLRAVREAMIRRGWVRESINKHISRVRRMFKWAVGEELLPVHVHQSLVAVPDLRRGRCDAKEAEPVKPVSDEHVYPVLEWVSAQVRTMIQVQLLTGARPGEVCAMRPCEIDRSVNPWKWTPTHHKNEHRDQSRVIYIGPKAQAIIAPYLLRPADAYLFSAREAESASRADRNAARRTPLNAGNAPGRNTVAFKTNPKRRAGPCYTVDSYRRAIARACDRADAWVKGGMIIGNDERAIPRWHPHQLRHTAGTRIRAEYGLEGAQFVLGHKTLSAAQIYAERSEKLGREIMSEVG